MYEETRSTYPAQSKSEFATTDVNVLLAEAEAAAQPELEENKTTEKPGNEEGTDPASEHLFSQRDSKGPKLKNQPMEKPSSEPVPSTSREQ